MEKNDPFAGYTPVRMAHPVVDEDVPELAPSRPPPRRRRPGVWRRWWAKAWGVCLCVTSWLVVAVAVTALGCVAYGWFYGRPVTDEFPGLPGCVRSVNALSSLGRAAHARVAGPGGVNAVCCAIPAGGNAPGDHRTRAETLGATRQKALEDAQRFADGSGNERED